MLIAFILLWGLVLVLNYIFAQRTKSDKKLSNALKAMIIIPMSVLGYVLHPIFQNYLDHQNWISLSMMVAMSVFAFLNLSIIKKLRNRPGIIQQ